MVQSDRYDTRYTVTKEYCGETEPMFILRFCREWVSKHATAAEANEARKQASDLRSKRTGTVMSSSTKLSV